MLKILYYNARSLLPKFAELLILADSHNPDVICITESWLSIDIQDSEILIPGYQSLRHDRNGHGGGILMYVSHRFTVKLLPFHPSLELLTVTLHSGIFKLCLSLFYHPPGLSVEVLYFCITTFSQLTFPSFLVLYLLLILILIFLTVPTRLFLTFVTFYQLLVWHRLLVITLMYISATVTTYWSCTNV